MPTGALANLRLPRCAAAVAVVLAIGMPTPRAQDATGLPGGANSLREGHGDWTVTCGVQAERGKVCALSQEQLDSRSRQRVLAIELRPAADGGVEGTLLLPFGLALDRGATLQIDDAEPGEALRFRTCLPAGCLVPIAFDSRTVDALRKSATLKVTTAADGGEETAFAVSLKGFSSALDRVVELVK